VRYVSVVALSVTAAGALSFAAAVPAEAASPAKISNVEAVAGPGVGEITINFKSTNANTSGYRVKTGLSSFKATKSGRNAQVFSFSGHRNSITLSADQVAAAGAAPATANHLYFRLSAMNGSTARAYPKLQAGTPRPVAPKASGTVVRVASFNVRTARATGDARNWLTRAVDVANDINDNTAGIVALQELGPGRADGKTGSLDGTMRQTDSLVRALSSIGADQYKLVRTTPYNAPGTDHATQGARLLYDSSRYSVVSKCAETTGKSNWNGSCSFDLPVLDSEGPGARRSAAYAEFADKRTGKHFFVFSAHMDQRHGKTAATEAKYEELRRESAAKINSVVESVNTENEDVIVAGDFNSWQSKIVGNAPHDYLIDRGYYDTAAAMTTDRLQYPTVNHFDTVLAPGGLGYGVRIDVILVKGTQGSRSFTNVVDPTDSTRASDHNMVISELVL